MELSYNINLFIYLPILILIYFSGVRWSAKERENMWHSPCADSQSRTLRNRVTRPGSAALPLRESSVCDFPSISSRVSEWALWGTSVSHFSNSVIGSWLNDERHFYITNGMVATHSVDWSICLVCDLHWLQIFQAFVLDIVDFLCACVVALSTCWYQSPDTSPRL